MKLFYLVPCVPDKTTSPKNNRNNSNSLKYRATCIRNESNREFPISLSRLKTAVTFPNSVFPLAVERAPQRSGFAPRLQNTKTKNNLQSVFPSTNKLKVASTKLEVSE